MRDRQADIRSWVILISAILPHFLRRRNRSLHLAQRQIYICLRRPFVNSLVYQAPHDALVSVKIDGQFFHWITITAGAERISLTQRSFYCTIQSLVQFR